MSLGLHTFQLPSLLRPCNSSWGSLPYAAGLDTAPSPPAGSACRPEASAGAGVVAAPELRACTVAAEGDSKSSARCRMARDSALYARMRACM